MNFSKLIPLIVCLSLGCTRATTVAEKPTPLTAKSSTADVQAVETARQRERRIPCSAEWLKTATEVQRKNCLNQNSINQVMDALSTRPSSTKKPPSTSPTKP